MVWIRNDPTEKAQSSSRKGLKPSTCWGGCTWGLYGGVVQVGCTHQRWTVWVVGMSGVFIERANGTSWCVLDFFFVFSDRD